MILTLWQSLANARQVYLVLLALASIGMLWRSQPKRIRLQKSVPVIGVKSSRGIATARENFRQNARDILIEGYTNVCKLHTAGPSFLLTCL